MGGAAGLNEDGGLVSSTCGVVTLLVQAVGIGELLGVQQGVGGWVAGAYHCH